MLTPDYPISCDQGKDRGHSSDAVPLTAPAPGRPVGPYVSEMVDDFGDHVVIKSVRANAAAGVANRIRGSGS
jgi:hypothetical protein